MLLTFKLNVLAYPSETYCMSHNDVVHTWKQSTLRNHRDHFDLTTQTSWKMCHAAPAYNSWTFQTFSGPLSFSHQNSKLMFVWSTSTSGYQSFHQLVVSRAIARKFIKTVVITDCFCCFSFFFSPPWFERWMLPNLLVTHCDTHLISEAYLLRKLKNLCRGAAASLSYKYPA